MEKGIDYTKDNVYDAIGRPDLKPTAIKYCKYDSADSFRTKATKSCDWCGDHLCGFCGYIVDDETACNECYKTISECTHSCTSNCRREGCNCECGEYHKDIPAHARTHPKES
jgi:hypothetical protein